MLNIGNCLKKLRLQNNLTQEQLAEIFDTSAQAISRWENGITYPDISMLPAIANYFGITLDELFSMSEIRNREKINAIFEQVHELETDKRTDEAIEILRKAIKIYPNNYGLISELAIALSDKDDITLLNEAISLSEKVLQNSTSEKLRSTTRANLCLLYLKSGLHDKAAAFAKTFPHIWECREILSVYVTNADERTAVLQKSINTALTVICSLIDTNMENNIFALGTDFEQQADIEEMINKISLFLK